MKLSMVGGIIAAASKKVAKPLMQVGEISVIRRIVISYQQAGIFPIVIITGAQEDEVKKQLASLGVIFLQNDRSDEPELMDSVRIGLKYLYGKCDRVAFTPVNVPMFTPATVSALLRVKADIVAPSHHGRGGHPVILADRVIPQLMDYKGPGGLRNAMKECDVERVWVETEDRGVVTSVYNEDELEARLKDHNNALLHPVLHMQLESEVPFFSDRLKLLLFLLADTQNMHEACTLSGLAPSKAWSMINKLEQSIDLKVVERLRGGKSGGSTSLTSDGLDFYMRYTRFEARVYSYAQEEFKKRFS
ncbi:MAG: NTP transferase domain-containing protein [Lachnospiraceae bacterium]|nr:NTP transferase domain-containing protein [Lachnospiraceae bacterium]